MSAGIFKFSWLLCLSLAAGGCREKTSVKIAPQSIEKAWQQYGFGAFDSAVENFKKIVEGAPAKSELRAQALYGLATVWDLRRPDENPQRAREIFQKVIDSHPSSPFAAWSALAIVRIQAIVPVGQQPDAESIRKGYQSVIDRYPDQMASEEATILQQVTLIESFRSAEARKAESALKKFIVAHPTSYYLSAAHSLLADCYRVLGEPGMRLQEEITALEVHENQSRSQWEKKYGNATPFLDATTSSAIFKIANIAEFESGDFPTARKYYRRFIDENPTEKRNFYARQALERMDRVESELRRETSASNPS